MAVIHGGYYTKELSAATVSATSPFTANHQVDCRGYAFGCVENTGSSTTITWYAGFHADDTPHILRDEDGVTAKQVLGANEVWALPSAMAGCGYMYPICQSGTKTLTVHLER